MSFINKFSKKRELINLLAFSIKNQIIKSFTMMEIFHIFRFNNEIFHCLYEKNSENGQNQKNSSEKVETVQPSECKSNSNQEEEMLANFIRSDDIESFKNYISRTNLPLDSKVFKSNQYNFIENSLISYSASFGSVNIFKYLYNHLDTFPTNILSAAVIGGNYEIIHLIESKNIKPNDSVLSFTISRYKNDLFDYFTSNYPIKLGFSAVESSIISQNYYVLRQIFAKNQEFLTNINYINRMFSVACSNDIRTLFNILYLIPDLDVNISLEISKSFF